MEEGFLKKKKCTFGRTTGRATLPEWIYSQGVYFEPRAGGEVKMFGYYTNKQTNKTKGLLSSRS